MKSNADLSRIDMWFCNLEAFQIGIICVFKKVNNHTTHLFIIIAVNSHFTAQSLLENILLKILCVLVVKLKTLFTSFLNVTNTIAFEGTCLPVYLSFVKVRKVTKIRNLYNQAPYLTEDTNGKMTTSQLDITT